MKFLVLYLTSTLLIGTYARKKWKDLAKDAVDEQDKELSRVERSFVAIGRQLMLQQFAAEEQTRSSGSSGIKQIRVRRSGSKIYYAESHVGGSMASIHNHANNIRTVGMGEFVAVINGVEFRTRHNDYRLYMPHRTSSKYHDVESLPFPEVPPEVAKIKDVEGQIKEMREWFKAWRNQNYTVRDYRKYFRANLCYLEGGWTTAGSKIDEPFDSDRHFIDAKNWQELQDRIRFTSYTGSKSRLENLAYLPTKIMRFINETVPVFAQWNYRILCYPLKDDLPTKKLKLVDDLAGRMAYKKTMAKLLFSRQARFKLDPHLDKGQTSDKMYYGRTFLDSLMEQIPGKNNKGVLHDLGLDGADPALDMETGKKLNVANYHRHFKVGRRDAMGVQGVRRGFSEEGAFAAQTTQDKVAGLDIENRRKCKWNRQLRKRVCEKVHQKWTWAIPLEIIYLTPLSRWNPYNLEYRGDARKPDAKLASSGKNGNCNDKNLQYNGTNSKAYFHTPNEFFVGSTMTSDKADTSRGAVCVLDRNGVSRKMRASGTYVFLPKIPGVGVLRQRYPIMPVHGEGSSVWKELEALKNMVLNPKVYEHMRWDSDKETHEDLELETGFSKSSNPNVNPHTHTLTLTPSEVKQLKGGNTITLTTSSASGHQHTMVVQLKSGKYMYMKCDGNWMCRDKHPRLLEKVDENEV